MTLQVFRLPCTMEVHTMITNISEEETLELWNQHLIFENP